MPDCVGPVTEVAPSAWVPVLLLSIVSFVTALGSALHAMYSSRKSRLSLAAYQADVAYMQVNPALDELRALAAKINSACDAGQHGAGYEKGYAYNYALYFANCESTDPDAFATISRCRRHLSAFWQGIFLLVDGQQLPVDFLDAQRRPWVTRGEALRQLLEPVDVASYYRRWLDADNRAEYLEGSHRPAHYKALQELALPLQQQQGLDQAATEELVVRLKAVRVPRPPRQS